MSGVNLVFPLGPYLRPQHRPGGEEPAGHRVWLGASLRWLGSEPELLAWTLAPGLGALAGDAPRTREALVEQGWTLLPELLSELHGLLGVGGAYLDHPVEGETRDARISIH